MTVESFAEYVKTSGPETKLRSLRLNFGVLAIKKHWADMSIPEKRMTSHIINCLGNVDCETAAEARYALDNMGYIKGLNETSRDFGRRLFLEELLNPSLD